ncbi:MAG TPA: RNA methyltransferase [Bacillota bacterium]|nr:RNA methyltransferase [Bacillota bacterium]
MELITSTSNDLVKLVMSLHHKKGRKEQKLFIAEGIHPVTEALKAGIPIQRYIWTSKLTTSFEGKTLLDQLQSRYQGIEVSEHVFRKMSETESPQGILALIEIPSEKPIDFSRIRFGLIVDGVQDPGNIGTIIRTAWAAGLDSLFFTPGTADPYQGKVVRATMGGIFNQNLFPNRTPEYIYKNAEKHGIQIIAGYPDATQSYFEVEMLGPTLFLVGNEGKGVSEVWDNYPIRKVYIPQPGQAESLNVAVSAGILIYEAVRQRMMNRSCKN